MLKSGRAVQSSRVLQHIPLDSNRFADKSRLVVMGGQKQTFALERTQVTAGVD